MIKSRFGRLALVVFALSAAVASYLFYLTYGEVTAHRAYLYQPWAAAKLAELDRSVAVEASAVVDITDAWMDENSLVMRIAHHDYSSHGYVGCHESPYNWETCIDGRDASLAMPMAWSFDEESKNSFRCPVIENGQIVDVETRDGCSALAQRLHGAIKEKRKSFVVNGIVDRSPILLSVLFFPTLGLMLLLLIYKWIVAAPVTRSI